MVFASKDQYRGQFLRGVMHGHGEFTFKEGGGKYTGEFQDGEFK
jgi:hypothetical protein